eukprot:TRINITY_DN1183_c0_g1_i1.p1 TRINITY_DN1183_c0_g1~~TRINITY_DN1183_c0_g1_i1.p1  ORF type:complete len:504 (+),score=120.97 TRINITY_DN1183_c0_g1_i1:125-1636(+)
MLRRLLPSARRVVHSSIISRAMVFMPRSTSIPSRGAIMAGAHMMRRPSFSPPSLYPRTFATASRDAPTSGIIPFNLADVGEGIAECEILKWHVKEGDSIKEFDPLCDVQSDKATVEITSRYDGVVKKIYTQKGAMAKVGKPLIDIDLGGTSPSASASASKPASSVAPPATVQASDTPFFDETTIRGRSGPVKVMATPAVRNVAKTNNIQLSQVRGTGKDGRVLKEDVLNFISGGSQPSQTQPTPSQTSPRTSANTFAPTPSPSRPVSPIQQNQTVPLSGIRRVMAKTMTAAALVPHFGYCEEYTVDGLMHLRSQLKPIADTRQIKLSYLPIILKATSLALSRYPILNSSINQELTEVTLKASHNIGVAVDTPHGLLVPNIKDIQNKSILEIAQELNRLQNDARDNKLSTSDLQGGTFTLSNIGTIGGTYASPVLLLPEVAIGAIGRIQKVPRFDSKGNVHPVHVMQISWSADHRVIDGATMANFSNVLKNYLEHPSAMLFDLK